MKHTIVLTLTLIANFAFAGKFFTQDVDFGRLATGSAPELQKGENAIIIRTACTWRSEVLLFSKDLQCDQISPIPQNYDGSIRYENFEPSQFKSSTTMGDGKTYSIRNGNGDFVSTGQKMRMSDYLRLSQIAVSPSSPIYLILNKDMELVKVLETH